MEFTEKNKPTIEFPVIYTITKWTALLVCIVAFSFAFNLQEYFVPFLICISIVTIGMIVMLIFEFKYDRMKFRRSAFFMVLFFVALFLLLKLSYRYEFFVFA
jgi:hypothetical protein